MVESLLKISFILFISLFSSCFLFTYALPVLICLFEKLQRQQGEEILLYLCGSMVPCTQKVSILWETWWLMLYFLPVWCSTYASCLRVPLCSHHTNKVCVSVAPPLSYFEHWRCIIIYRIISKVLVKLNIV